MLLGHEQTFQHLFSLLSPVPRRRAFGLISPVGVGRQHFVKELYTSLYKDIPAIIHPLS